MGESVFVSRVNASFKVSFHLPTAIGTRRIACCDLARSDRGYFRNLSTSSYMMTIVGTLGARTRRGHTIPNVAGIPEKQDISKLSNIKVLSLFGHMYETNNKINIDNRFCDCIFVYRCITRIF